MEAELGRAKTKSEPFNREEIAVLAKPSAGQNQVLAKTK